ncbi:hypothetical protein FJD37_23330 [Pseudomonas saxonica]|uniref:Secreted protein n=1 Tax=Pseudomonas saxonica TaxID=2600598 RepID=A0A5C5PQC3_9PSED|nr:hypothetical protein FJD37_23330 [Pseudomonas saxonica]
MAWLARHCCSSLAASLSVCSCACSASSAAFCSGLMKPDTHLGENARHIEVSDDQATSCLFR